MVDKYTVYHKKQGQKLVEENDKLFSTVFTRKKFNSVTFFSYVKIFINPQIVAKIA